MDDRNQSFLSVLAQVFRSSSQGGVKQASSDGPGPSKSKKVNTPCQNWNLGVCEDPCVNRHKHGVCSECSGQHTAQEVNSCLTQLQAHFGKALMVEAQKVVDLAAGGPKTFNRPMLKRKASGTSLDGPCY